jgi:GT2 family glycosyltransferase
LEVVTEKAVGLKYKMVQQENAGRACVRNRGASESIGELLIFFDDDMRPEPECVEVHVRHHLKFKDSILTGAQVEEVKPDTNEFIRFKAYLSNRWKKESANYPLVKGELFITAANFSVSKKIFNALGGFDERLKDAEDFDLAVRAFKNAISLYIDYNALAWHDDQVNCAAYIKRQRQYTLAHARLIALKPWMKDEGFIQPAVKPRGWKNGIFKAFLKKYWIVAVDSNKFTWLPKKIRYKLYDLIISANGVFFPEKVKL